MIMNQKSLVAIALLAVIGYIVGSICVPRTAPGENEKRDSGSCSGRKF